MKVSCVYSVSLCFVLAIVVQPRLWGAPGAEGLLAALQAKYQVTQTTLDRTQITSPGTVLDIQAYGINAEPFGTIINLENRIVDGKVQQRSRWSEMVKTPNMRVLQPGEKVYVTKIETKNEGKNDSLKFSILTCDPYDVGDSQKRYATVVSFKLPKDYLAQSSPDEIEQMINAVLAPDAGGPASQGNAAGGENYQGQAAAAATPAPAAPMAAPAPAPAPPAAPQTISIGQTISQVVEILGQPLQIIDLGSKKTYKYKDLKVIFVNGKVSDVQ